MRAAASQAFSATQSLLAAGSQILFGDKRNPSDTLTLPMINGKAVDPWLLGVVAALLAIGLIMVGSASIDYAARQTGDPFYFTRRHGIYLCLGFAMMVMGITLPMKFWQRYSGVLLLAGFALLVLVLIPGIGRRVNGSQRWLSLGGFTLQASELMKVFLLFYLADYFVRWEKELSGSFGNYMKPMVIIVLVCGLLLMEPDFGATVVILTASLAVIFVAGVPLLRFLLLMLGAIGLAALAIFLEPYRLKRLTSFADPWNEDVKFGSAYQLTQSLIALGRGEWWGVGLGNSVQKLFYLPEAHTDFVFSVWAEETGFIGVAVVMVLFGILLSRALLIGIKALRHREAFIAYVTLGIAVILGVQALINMGVVSGLLPTKGLTLPFLSYGGSSLLVCCWMAGLLMRAHWEIAALYGTEKIQRRGHS